MTDMPAFVGNGRGDVLAANPLAQALYAPMFDDPTRPANHARFAFLNPRARDLRLLASWAASRAIAPTTTPRT